MLGSSLWGAATLHAADPNAHGWTWTTNAIGRVTYDDNIYLQSVTSLADRDAWVTLASPTFALAWRSPDHASTAFSYAPEWTRFERAPVEDFIAHRVSASAARKLWGASLETNANAAFVDGDDESLIWTGPGGAPATGAAAVRDRRDAAVYRGNLRMTWQADAWTVRTVAALYTHDFQTAHRADAGYQNFVDRGEYSAGFDLGRRLGNATVSAGYRHGMQTQDRLLSYPEEYDNRFHRALAGVEGGIAPWLRVNLTFGPELRRYGNRVPGNFGDRSGVNFYLDGSATITAAQGDSIVVVVKQFEQMSGSGRGAYTDFTADVLWRHKFASGLLLGAGARGYRTDFLAPVVRDDWILAQHLLISVPVGRSMDLEASYTHEAGISDIPSTAGREYRRNLVSAAVKIRFE